MWVASGNSLLFALQTENLISLFMEIPFVSVYKVVDSVTQQVRNGTYKTQTATTGRQPVQFFFFFSELNISALSSI